MRIIIKNKQHLDKLIKEESMIGNVYWEVNEQGFPFNYKEINWNKEYITLDISGSTLILIRHNYNIIKYIINIIKSKL